MRSEFHKGYQSIEHLPFAASGGRFAKGTILSVRMAPFVSPKKRKGLLHRRGITIPAPVGRANRAASSKLARFIRRWRRFANFHARGKKHLSACKCASISECAQQAVPPQNDGSAIVLKFYFPNGQIG